VQQREVTLRTRTRRPPVDAESLVGFALDVMARLEMDGAVAIEICGPKRMADLNGRYRNKPVPTDVLAFPDGDPDGTGQTHIGDLALCAAVIESSGKERGHGFALELRRVLLHGLLHLAGYDHEADRGQMRRRERALALSWGLPA